MPLAQSDIVGPVTATIRTGGHVRSLRQGEDIAVRATFLPMDQIPVEMDYFTVGRN